MVLPMKRLPFRLAVLAVLGVLAALAPACAPERNMAMGDLLVPGSSSQAVHEVAPVGETTFGIDVSYYQGDIDWNAAAADPSGAVKFAIIRASDGLGFRDPKFEENWAGAKAAGIVRGVYQFFRSDEDPVAQANLMLEMMGALEPGDLPPTMDMESTDGVDAATRIARMHQWFDVVDAAVGAPAFIYTGGYFWDDNVGTDEFNHHPLWHAGYTGGSAPTTVSNAWSTWHFWQYASSPDPGIDGRNVAGIDGNVDQNRFNGTFAQLLELTVGDPVCGDGRCSTSETGGACVADCPVCEPLPSSGGVITEAGPCFTGGGPSQYLRRVSDAGEGGGLIWTHTTDDAAEANFGEWQVLLTEAGRYRLEAYTAGAYAQSRQARYAVRHAGADDEFIVDQTAVDGWTVVSADLTFDSSGGTVHVGDNTGEALGGDVQLVFDALRLVRLDGDGPQPGEGEGEPAPSEGEGEAGEGEGEGGGGDGADRVGPAFRPSTNEGGCRCVPSGSLGGLAAILFILTAARGRRHR